MRIFFPLMLLCLFAANGHAQLKYKKDIGYNKPRYFACNFFTSTALLSPEIRGNPAISLMAGSYD